MLDRLQWGRACEDADRYYPLLYGIGMRGFNGAAPVRTRIAVRPT